MCCLAVASFVCPSPPLPPPQVWHKDLFLTDDFLGHVTIPLTDVAVQKWDDDGDAAPPGG